MDSKNVVSNFRGCRARFDCQRIERRPYHRDQRPIEIGWWTSWTEKCLRVRFWSRDWSRASPTIRAIRCDFSPIFAMRSGPSSRASISRAWITPIARGWWLSKPSMNCCRWWNPPVPIDRKRCLKAVSAISLELIQTDFGTFSKHDLRIVLIWTYSNTSARRSRWPQILRSIPTLLSLTQTMRRCDLGFWSWGA